MHITFNDFTRDLIKKGIAITEIQTKAIKERAQLLLTCAEINTQFIFNWNKKEKRWILANQA